MLRRQSRDTNRNIKRSVYCQYVYSLTFRALALRQRETGTTDSSLLHAQFYLYIPGPCLLLICYHHLVTEVDVLSSLHQLVLLEKAFHSLYVTTKKKENPYSLRTEVNPVVMYIYITSLKLSAIVSWFPIMLTLVSLSVSAPYERPHLNLSRGQ